ncbi:coiled-coil domain-containing protein-domain-containing protein [Gilbertella persicaria]|uniref:coiled-coil domain-containing protein-domain-containing protein n=1 Tax=Gilbertella persicaria TaxID=101096 RepID=UPI00221ECF64|nr:coiled-coil domain-containing protein-domain-containing protein [Gilbertella persicaria]KAI8084243.1 coiled-coil domain-containing protein-domain-containing protein [Gilbertella persicaria]
MDETTRQQIMAHVERNMANIPFKTLRYGEIEPTQEEKLHQMQLTLLDDPALFLGKWGRHLSQTTLRMFKVVENNYEVDFYLNSLLYQESQDVDMTRPVSRKSAMHQLAQNRRYEFLQRELKYSDYFSDESIRLREPVLYDQYVGQHIPVQERTKPFENNMTLVNRIFSNMDQKYVYDHLDQQKIVDEERFEEEEEDSEDEIMEKSTPFVMTKNKGKQVTTSEEQEEEQDIEDMIEFREQQRLELIRLLEEKFLAGKDKVRFIYFIFDILKFF